MPYDAPGQRIEVTYDGGADGKTPIATNSFAFLDNKVLLLTKTGQLDRYVRPDSDEATQIQPGELCVGFLGGVHELAMSAGQLSSFAQGDKLWLNTTDNTIVQSAGGGTSGSDANEKTSFKVQGTGGTFQIVLNHLLGAPSTGKIKFNATTDEVREALEAVDGIEPGDVVVTGGPGNEAGSAPYVVEWTGQFEKTDITAPTATDELTGGEEKVTVTTSTAGAGSTDTVVPLGVIDEIDTSRDPDVAKINSSALHAFIGS
jgi:hypothetical protein